MYEGINDRHSVVASSFPLVSEVASACLLLVSRRPTSIELRELLA